MALVALIWLVVCVCEQVSLQVGPKHKKWLKKAKFPPREGGVGKAEQSEPLVEAPLTHRALVRGLLHVKDAMDCQSS